MGPPPLLFVGRGASFHHSNYWNWIGAHYHVEIFVDIANIVIVVVHIRGCRAGPVGPVVAITDVIWKDEFVKFHQLSKEILDSLIYQFC